MSKVPPSPAIAITFVSVFPSFFSADSMPAATAAAHSNATCMYGTGHDVAGYADETISEHDVAFDIITFFPDAFRMLRMAIVAGHPAHAVCPQYNSSAMIITILFYLVRLDILPRSASSLANQRFLLARFAWI